jgi:ketosteroid isomerase-like protein
VPAVLAIFSEDITFKVAGNNPVAGDYRGHDEVVGFFQKLGEGSNGTFKVRVEDILDNGDETVVALVTHLAHRDDADLDVPAVHVWTVRDLKCTGHVSYVFDVKASDAFWS